MKVIKQILRIIIYIIIAIAVSIALSFSVIYYQTSRENFKYQEEIEKYANEYNMDPMLISAIVKVESGFNNEAQSQKDAKGLMQLMNETAQHISDLEGIDYIPEKLEDPDYNLMLGTSYIRYLYDYYGNIDLALAAYNGGIGNVDDWIKDGTIQRNNPNVDNIPIEETRQYVKKVNANYNVMRTFYKDKLPKDTENQKTITRAINNYKSFLKVILFNA
ncbi:MAG: lytic transglycosylase domain-containing protein [Tissierellia bacterium]|nr:lytic transglycosylase domain-containing protein [Tissierellia bacterium]